MWAGLAGLQENEDQKRETEATAEEPDDKGDADRAALLIRFDPGTCWFGVLFHHLCPFGGISLSLVVHPARPRMYENVQESRDSTGRHFSCSPSGMSSITWIPPKNDEIRAHTSEASNARIDRETSRAVSAASESRDAIQTRLAELDREWNVDRALMLNFAVLGGLSAALTMRSLARSGRVSGWGALFFTQIAFLANHAIQRWCPPMPVFRMLGFRSQREIDSERQLLEKQLAA